MLQIIQAPRRGRDNTGIKKLHAISTSLAHTPLIHDILILPFGRTPRYRYLLQMAGESSSEFDGWCFESDRLSFESGLSFESDGCVHQSAEINDREFQLTTR